MKNQVLAVLTLVALLFPLDVLFAQGDECTESETINYSWEWCGQNLGEYDSQNPVEKVCYGQVVVEDISYGAIKLLSFNKSQKCYFEEGNWLELNEPDCKGGVYLYAASEGNKVNTVVKRCRNEKGETTKVVGTDPYTYLTFKAQRDL